MDSQNQTSPEQPNNPQPPNSSVPTGGQRVIQPIEAILNHVQTQSSVTPTQEPSVIQPSPNVNPSTPESTPPVASTPSTPQTWSPNSDIGMSGNELARAEETKRGRRRMIMAGISVIVLILILVVGFVFRAPLIALLPSKFVTYTYPTFKHQEPFKITVDFYKNSKIVEYTPATPPGATPISPSSVLMSPVQKGSSAIILRIVAGPINSAAQALASKLNACNNTGQSEGPTIYIPSLSGTADMCQSTGQINGQSVILGYESGIISPSTNSAYFILLNSNYTFQSTTQGVQIDNAVNFQNYQNDVQHIVSSIKYVKE